MKQHLFAAIALITSVGADRDTWAVARRKRASLFCARVARDASASGRST